MKSKKILKVVVAATLATAFVAPVVAPSFVPVAEASASALNSQLSELITISKDVQNTPEYKRVFYNNRDWLETATSNAKSNLDYGNVNEKQTSIDALKAELNRPEIYKIVTQLYRSLPAGFSNYYERESTRTIKELITYTNYVIDTPEYERMYYNSRDWLETALSDARSQALYGDEIDQNNATNKLRAELNRYPMNTVLDAVKVNQPANFYNYSEPEYHTEIKFLITVSNAILKTPEYERLFYNSRDWFETALSNARSQALYGDELDQKAASNALKAELNRHGIRPIAERVQTNVPGYFIEYTEESYDNEIKKLIIISNYVLNENDYKALAYETRDSFETVLSDARSQALYGDRLLQRLFTK